VVEPLREPASLRKTVGSALSVSFLGIEGLRGFAAVAIMLHHVRAQRFSHAYFGPFLEELSLGVPVFFVISGFLLFRPHVVRQIDGRRPADPTRFLARRGARVVPAYLLMLVGAALIVPAPNWLDLGGARYVFFLQEFSERIHTDSLLAGIGSTWSVCIEVWLYIGLAAILAALAYRRPKLSTQLDALVALAVVLVVCVALATPIKVPWDWSRSGLAFVCGCILAILHARGAGVVQRAVGAPVVLAAVVVAMFVAGGLAPLGALRVVFGTVLAVGAVLLALGVNRTTRGWRRVFLSPGVLWVGAISYGIYLWHQPILFSLRGGSRPAAWDAPAYLESLAAITLTVLVAAASWYGVERRILERMRWGSSRVPAAEGRLEA
jgi:peptidoglycan/LPS O-acetylase OafA/YrhL